MLGFEVGEKLSCWPNPAMCHIVETLTDTLLVTGIGDNIEKMLIGCGVLNDGGGPGFEGWAGFFSARRRF